MKLKGVPKQVVNMDLSISINTGEDGIIDLDKTLENILNKILIPRLTPRYPVIEEIQEEPKEDVEENDKSNQEEDAKEEKTYTCKTCGETIQGFGDFMTHCRGHKKEGDS